MAKAVIKSKSGAVITIEGTKDEVCNIIAGYERTVTASNIKTAVAKASTVRKEQKKRGAASDLIIDLKEDGFFEKPKGLGEISKALEEKGFIYPVTTLSGVVLGLVQRRLLGRKRMEGRWVYGK